MAVRTEGNGRGTDMSSRGEDRGEAAVESDAKQLERSRKETWCAVRSHTCGGATHATRSTCRPREDNQVVESVPHDPRARGVRGVLCAGLRAFSLRSAAVTKLRRSHSSHLPLSMGPSICK